MLFPRPATIIILASATKLTSSATAMEGFLREFLRVENKVQSNSTRCHICMQDCEDISPETGAVEYALRLPGCSHIFGSCCITTWLRSNNSCPICRRILFLPKPSTAPDTVAADGEDNEGSEVSLADNEEEYQYPGDKATTAIGLYMVSAFPIERAELSLRPLITCTE